MKRLLTTIMVLSCAASMQVWGQTRCNIWASVSNQQADATTDKNGTNIRKGPGTTFPVVKTLTSERGFFFHITASSGNWVHVDSVNMVDTTGKNRPLDGWVYAPSLFLKFESDGEHGKPYGKLFSQPSTSSKAVLSEAEMRRKNNTIVSLISCEGAWAKVLWEGTAGWLARNDQCSDFWDPCGER